MEVENKTNAQDERVLMANRLRKLRVKLWVEMYDNRPILESEEFSQLDEACYSISNVIGYLSEGESNEETE